MSLLLSSRLFNLGNSSMANSIVETPEGDYIIVGRIYNTTGSDSAFATRISASGTILWDKVYDSSFSQFLESVSLLKNGTFVATGSYFYSKYAGDEYVWVINFDGDGNILWQNAFGKVGVQSDGESIVATRDGGFIVAALSVEGEALTWVIKCDNKGNVEWEHKYDIGKSYSIVQTMDGGYALTGATSPDDGFNSNPFILRINHVGNVVWQEVYNDYSIYLLLDSSIKETSDGHFAVAARTLIMEVDCCGNVLFGVENKRLVLNNILQLSDGNYAVGGAYIVNDSDHSYIATIDRNKILNDPSGVILWDDVEIKYNSSYRSVIVDKSGFLVGCGFMSIDNINVESFFAVFDLDGSVI